MGDVMNQHAFRAVTRLDHFTVLAAFERCCQAVEPQFALLLFWSMTLDAGLFENRLDIRIVSYPLFVRGRRKLADINSFFVGCQAGKKGRRKGGSKARNQG